MVLPSSKERISAVRDVWVHLEVQKKSPQSLVGAWLAACSGLKFRVRKDSTFKWDRQVQLFPVLPLQVSPCFGLLCHWTDLLLMRAKPIVRVLLTLLSSHHVLFLWGLVCCSSEATGDCVVVCAGSIFSELSNLLCACRDLPWRTLSVHSCFIFTCSQELLADVLCMPSTLLTHHLPELSVTCLISAWYSLHSHFTENQTNSAMSGVILDLNNV